MARKPALKNTTNPRHRKLTMKDIRAAAKRLSNWGRWGKDDEIGTLNYVSAEDIVEAARLVRKGKVMSLGLNYDQYGPQGAKSKYPSLGRFNPIHCMLRTGTDDLIIMPLQCGTQWDGLGHMSPTRGASKSVPTKPTKRTSPGTGSRSR